MKHYCDGTHVTPGNPALYFFTTNTAYPKGTDVKVAESGPSGIYEV